MRVEKAQRNYDHAKARFKRAEKNLCTATEALAAARDQAEIMKKIPYAPQYPADWRMRE